MKHNNPIYPPKWTYPSRTKVEQELKRTKTHSDFLQMLHLESCR